MKGKLEIQRGDELPRSAKSLQMSNVRPQHTAPELRVRRSLFAAGVRYRLHRRDLPGRPDVYVGRLNLALFINGCFWHGHSCRRGKLPKTNVEFWKEKIRANRDRDRRVLVELEKMGFEAIVVWSCDLAGTRQVCESIAKRYKKALRRN